MVRYDLFTQMVESGADYLHRLSEIYTGSARIEGGYPISEDTWAAPCLLQSTYLDSVPLARVIGELYSASLTEAEVFAVWDRAVYFLSRRQHHDLLKWIGMALPDMPFSPTSEVGPSAPRACAAMVQFLQCAAHLRGDLDLGQNTALYRLSGHEIGFQRLLVKGLKSSARLHRYVPVQAGLKVPLRNANRPRVSTRIIHAHLLWLVPRLGQQITTFLQAVVHAGRLFEQIVASRFEIELPPESTPEMLAAAELAQLQQRTR